MKTRTILGTVAVVAIFASGVTGVAIAQQANMGVGGYQARGGMQMMDFDALDADKDGKVTAEEFSAHRAEQAKALDADADGKISEAELVAFHMKAAEARATAMAKRMIAAHDSDGDGLISAAELMTGAAQMPGLSRLDTDKDGAISKAELDAVKDRVGNRRGNHEGNRDGGHDGKGRMMRRGHSSN